MCEDVKTEQKVLQALAKVKKYKQLNDENMALTGSSKKDVIVLIEDERQNLFGGYIGNEIIINENINDDSGYVFSIRKNFQYETKRYFDKRAWY